jgi:hypothetical protein
MASSSSVGFPAARVGKPTLLAGFRCKSVGFRFVFVDMEFGPPVLVRFVTFIYVIWPINNGRCWFVVKAYIPQGFSSIC